MATQQVNTLFALTALAQAHAAHKLQQQCHDIFGAEIVSQLNMRFQWDDNIESATAEFVVDGVGGNFWIGNEGYISLGVDGYGDVVTVEGESAHDLAVRFFEALVPVLAEVGVSA